MHLLGASDDLIRLLLEPTGEMVFQVRLPLG
jgi:hypothetical protein